MREIVLFLCVTESAFCWLSGVATAITTTGQGELIQSRMVWAVSLMALAFLVQRSGR